MWGNTEVYPAQEMWLVEWVAEQDSKGRRYHGIRRDLYLLKTWHIDIGAPTTGFGSQLERAIRGLKRMRGVPPAKAKLPITLPLLRALLAQLPAICSGLDLLSCQAAFTLAFACFLRSGEITYDVFDPSQHLSIASVEITNDVSYIVVTLPASKTDPFKTGTKVVAPAVLGPECPVQAVLALAANRPVHSPLFQRSDLSPFTRTFLLDTLSATLKAAGVDPTGFSGHSFRRGAATWAHIMGCSDEEIRIMGRWSSTCARRYIDRSATERSNLARQLYRTRKGPLVPECSTWRSF